ncbi:hypothetical protein [Bifidobacterium sp.]|uniref:hypothetical protein n=1 Tax=Bifidobacterium sp. TaxID=41200 RepID=UPI0039E80B98
MTQQNSPYENGDAPDRPVSMHAASMDTPNERAKNATPQPNGQQFNASGPNFNRTGAPSPMMNQPNAQPYNRQPNMAPMNAAGYPYPQNVNLNQGKSAAKGFAIAGFILALIGLFVVVWQYSRFVSPFGTVGLVLSVVGILIQDKGEERSRATYVFAVVGVIVSILVIVMNLLMGIFDYQPSLY